MCVYVCVCVCCEKVLLRQARYLEDGTHSKARAHGTATTTSRLQFREREADVILKVMRAGAGIPEVDD